MPAFFCKVPASSAEASSDEVSGVGLEEVLHDGDHERGDRGRVRGERGA